MPSLTNPAAKERGRFAGGGIVMGRAGTSRLKVNPPLGNMPALQYLLPAQLKVDSAYQRSLDTGPSQTLIRKIAMYWNWDLCQPLVVSRRDNGDLYVIDGQHRLEAAKMRGDITQLPAVVVSYGSAADEAASFVHLNQQRRPLTKLDVFKAAVASGDVEACAILDAMMAAGLRLAPHSNHTVWEPGMVAHISGIEVAWRSRGSAVTKTALQALSLAFSGKVLQYAGTIWPGIVAVCADEADNGGFGRKKFVAFVAMLGRYSQVEWRQKIYAEHALDVSKARRDAAVSTLRKAWAEEWKRASATVTPISRPAPRPTAPIKAPSDGKRWCDQCEARVNLTAATTCKSPFCKLRPRLTA